MSVEVMNFEILLHSTITTISTLVKFSHQMIHSNSLIISFFFNSFEYYINLMLKNLLHNTCALMMTSVGGSPRHSLSDVSKNGVMFENSF